MRYVVKQKILSLFRRFEIYDKDENLIYVVKGTCSIPKRYHLFDASEENEQMYIKKKILSIMPRFDFYKGDELLFSAKREFTLKPNYEFIGADLTIEGNFFAWEFAIKNNGQTLATVMQKITLYRDAYVVDVEDNVDPVVMLLITIMLDHFHHRTNTDDN